MQKTIKFCFAALLVMALCAIAFAQSTTTGAIGGVVTNPNKEVVAGASVSVKNTETNKETNKGTKKGTRGRASMLGLYALSVVLIYRRSDPRGARRERTHCAQSFA